MTRSEDVQHAIQLGVDALGFVFYAKSPRAVTLEQAKLLLKNIPPFVDVVAVLVNPDKEFVQRILEELPVTLLQFHGDETPEFCQQFNMPYIKALHPFSETQILNTMNEFESARALLLDSASSGVRGGTGLSFNWQVIPKILPKPYILAGGLNELNVTNALNQSHPFAVDVCSGIEAVPGIKDHLKMELFVNAVWSKQ